MSVDAQTRPPAPTSGAEEEAQPASVADIASTQRQALAAPSLASEEPQALSAESLASAELQPVFAADDLRLAAPSGADALTQSSSVANVASTRLQALSSASLASEELRPLFEPDALRPATPSGADPLTQSSSVADIAEEPTRPPTAAIADESIQPLFADPAEAEILSATRELIAEAAGRPERFGDAAEAAAKLRRTAQLGTADAAELLSWATTLSELAKVRCDDGGDLLTVATEALVGMGHPHALLVDPNALEYAWRHRPQGEASIQSVLGWIFQLSGSVVGSVILIAAAIEVWGSSLAMLLAPGFLVASLLAGGLVSSKKKARRGLGLVLASFSGFIFLVSGLLLPSSDESLLTWAGVIALAIGTGLLAASHPPKSEGE